jgi:predicted CopG family antitoxin
MAVKTITIDMEAYDLLASEKRDGESFSKVIKRRLRPRYTARDLLENLDKIAFEEDTLRHMEEVIATRKDSLAESPILGTEE